MRLNGEDLDLETAMNMVADRVWESRERSFVEKQDDQWIMQTKAIAHLGYEQMKFLATVYPGDTLISQSEVLSKRDTSRPDRGVVKFRTTGFNQAGEKVLEYERPVLIRKRSAA